MVKLFHFSRSVRVPVDCPRKSDDERRVWYGSSSAGTECSDPAVRERLARAHAQFEARERQYTAVLQAHGVPVTFVHCPAGADARATLRA